MNSHAKHDKLVQVFPCEMLENDNRITKGKLYLMEKSYNFCPLLAYSQMTSIRSKSVHTLKYQFIKSIDVDDNTDTISIQTHTGSSHHFRNFYQQINQVVDILNSALQTIEPVQEVQNEADWEPYQQASAMLLAPLVKLMDDNNYRAPVSFTLAGLDIHEMFSLLYDDQKYKPSEYFKYDVKPFTRHIEHQNILHFFFEQIMEDKEFKATPWSPQVPEFLRTGDINMVPNSLPELNTLPTRTITFTHPTKLPFFGTINPKIQMTQRLLLIDQNSFIIQVKSETKGIPYCDSYRLKSHEKVTRIGQLEFQIECTETLEWNNRIMLISNKVDQAAAQESKKVIDTFYIPFAKSRHKELIQLKENNNSLTSSTIQKIGLKSSTTIVQSQSTFNSLRNLEPSPSRITFRQDVRQQADFKILEKKIGALEDIIISQQKNIKKMEEDQVFILQIDRICLALCFLLLFIVWLIR